MPAVLAPDRITLLQLHLAVAITTDVLRDGSDQFDGGLLEGRWGAKGGSTAARGLVGFAGHFPLEGVYFIIFGAKEDGSGEGKSCD